MCESLPLDRPWPRRLGNEEMCRRCRSGDCEHCASKHGTAVWCGCVDSRPAATTPETSKGSLMTDTVDDDPDYTTDVKADAADTEPLPATTDPATVPADEGDCGAAK